MENNTDRLKFGAIAVFVIQVVVLVVLQFVFKQPFSLVAAIFTLIDAVGVVYIIYAYEKEKKERVISISRILGTEAKNAMTHGQIGVIIYNDDYEATWASELFEERNITLIGEKITRSIPGSEILLNGDSDNAIFEIDGREYEFTRSDTSRVLYVKDVTEINKISDTYNKEKVVLGLIHLDNYDETVQYEDEQKIAAINTNIRQKIVDWCKQYDSMVRRLRSDRFLVVMNEEHFAQMLDDNFTILEDIKKEAGNLSVAITASMAFARGTSDFMELDNMINDLLELVLSRGGDQVAVKSYGDEVQFYGQSSEASEKTSKVRVRVIAQTLRGIIKDSDKVFIVPHKDADFDAIGSCIGVSRFVQAFDKEAYIIIKGITVENVAKKVVEDNYEHFSSMHNLISEADALEMMTKDSLVIICDHQSMDLTAASELVSRSKKVVVIDHHRRKSETNVKAMMIYNEPASSSAVELVTELIEYQPVRVELDEFESTFMYTGLLVDTDGFKSRCSSRSFEVCAYLRKEGADITMANEWLKDTLQQFETKTKVLKYSEAINDNIIIAALPEKEGIITRTIVSQVANYILTIKNIDAAFVIAQITDDTWALSGRSNGNINVQIILERMGGGGHFTAAGLQRTNSSVSALTAELKESIKKYLEGVDSNEGNSVE
ncbi:MAG: DHH family phosphoesterase [Erysipelotrichaceae bacterium]|nr:DHH family phosphoesterase [Erysipelotrichaceae bacterium]